MALVTKANALNTYAAVGWYQATMYEVYCLNGDYERALEGDEQDPAKQSLYEYIYNIAHLRAAQPANRKRLKTQACSRRGQAGPAKARELVSHLELTPDEDIAKLMDGIRKSGVLGVEAKPG